ncbi:MAG: GIVxVP protein [Cyanobium sp.]
MPSLLLGGAFLSAAAWMDGPAAQNKGLALTLGAVLLGAGVLSQWLPTGSPTPPQDKETPP